MLESVAEITVVSGRSIYVGVLILIVTALVQIILAVYSLRTQSNQQRVRYCVSVVALALFAIALLTSIIQWSFRWYLLSAVLVLWALVGSAMLLRTVEVKKPYKPTKAALKAVASWLIVFIAVLPALLFPQFRDIKTSGVYRVNTAVYTYTDNSRLETYSDTGVNRELTVEFWFPDNTEGRFPLVVFSHGAFGIRHSNTSTFMELASNGYVVCSVDHPYHAYFSSNASGKVTMVSKSFMQEVLDVNRGVYDAETAYAMGQRWLGIRTADLTFALNTIIESSLSGKGGVYKLIDPARIGLMGHSLGGAASVKLGRELDYISAVINLDADLLGEELGYIDGKPVINTDIYPAPLLSIYTDDMRRLMDNINPELLLPQKLISATSPHAFEVYIEGTNHMSVTDLPLFSPFLARMLSGTTSKSNAKLQADKYQVISSVNRMALSFFDCYLKSKGTFSSTP